ncbi:MAG: 23S rRNA (pseudouridine(1915)-N(3))-methyltransferase RlmH [Bacteroidales bacterium]
MKITLLTIGQTDDLWLREAIDMYGQRLKRYTSFETHNVTAPKKWNALPAGKRKEQEGKLLLGHIKESDYAVLLDEKGKVFNSVQFAGFIQERMNRSTRKLLFIVGGPWGFSREVYQAAQLKLSLSAMTFSHQMVRLFFTEQLYRAFTILKNEPYHNE